MEIARVVSCKKITDRWRLLKLRTSTMKGAAPGQFVHIRLSRATDPWLRRPVSIHYLEPGSGFIWLLFQVTGRGTEMLSLLKAGDPVDLMGPLGHGFQTEDGDRRVVLVAGGIGMAPLYFLAGRLREKGIPFEFMLGGPGKAALPADSYFQLIGVTPLRATDDGSQGFHGTVTALFQTFLSRGRVDRVYACGPSAMLKELVHMARVNDIPSQVSLEAHMACGVGACLGCVCAVRSDKQVEEYLRVCREGPVFNGETVIF